MKPASSIALDRRARALRLGAMLCLGLVGTLAATCRAGATTSDNVGLPPNSEMAVKWGHPLVGRNLLYSVSSKAGIRAGVLDVEAETEGEPEWFYGEFTFELYVKGKPTTVTMSLYPFKYVGNHHVTAGLVTPASITDAHPFGIPVGHVTFTVVRPFEEIKSAHEEPKFTKATISLNGRGPYEVEFQRGNDDAPIPDPLPSAKQIRN